MAVDPLGPAGWLADVLLEREAALIRGGASPVPHDFAGLVISDDEVDALLSGGGDERTTPVATPWDDAVEAARGGMTAALDSTPLGTVARAGRLSAAATEVLAVAVAIEFDPRRQRLAAFVQNDVNRPRLTLALVERLFGWPGLEAVAPDGPLAAAALVRVGNDHPWAASQVAPAPALCWAVAGVTRLGVDEHFDAWDVDEDPRFGSGGEAVPGREPWPIDADCGLVGEATPDAPAASQAAAPALDAPGLLLVCGGDRARRRQVAARAGRWRQTVTSRPETAEGWEALVCHATVTGRAPVVETELIAAADRRWLERATHLPWVVSSERELPLDCLPRRPWRELWAGESVPAGDEEWQAVTGRRRPPASRLSRTQLELVAPLLEDGKPVAAAVRRLARGHLDALTQRTVPRRTWSDLVVGEEQMDGLRLLCARWRHRDQVHDQWGVPTLASGGVVALFVGPSGTGKTLAAEVVAAELGLDMYRLDISTVVSKYIGETEKNLEQVFRAAAASEVLLFFDEADALFGKRSEVSDAHDRYANIEVAYLLQRLETHDGLVLLASNLQQNLDAAFVRRIDVLVPFPEPDEGQRRAIWQRSFGTRAPIGDLDLDWVARRFDLTGGEIRNVALESAVRAAAAGEPIGMSHVVAALRRELRKSGRLWNQGDFDRWVPHSLETVGAAPPG